jgi:hypothetical protein
MKSQDQEIEAIKEIIELVITSKIINGEKDYECQR